MKSACFSVYTVSYPYTDSLLDIYFRFSDFHNLSQVLWFTSFFNYMSKTVGVGRGAGGGGGQGGATYL